jgi:uncharacterized membrane protein YhaH (DUF805 family)
MRRYWEFSGGIRRAQYAALGAILILSKYTIDTLVALHLFQRSWSPFHYFGQYQGALWIEARDADRPFYTCMMLLSLPFLWMGVSLTLKRLRDARLPLWWVLLFFAPTVNLFFFLILCLAPSRQAESDSETESPDDRMGFLKRLMPRSSLGSASLAIGLSSMMGALFTQFNVAVLGVYGLGLFVGLPFSLGMMAVTLYGYRTARGWWACVGVGVASVSLTGFLLFVTSLEGAGCLLMASPIWLLCSALGSLVGCSLQRNSLDHCETFLLVLGLILVVPAFMGAEFATLPEAPLFEVTTTIDIDAPATRVWPHVVCFPPLPPATEWFFRAGVAHPLSAEIEGVGPGAIRRCNFSTGTFIEPIEVWDEPRRLRFSVASNPAPMEEWSLYEEVHPPHLVGFLESRAGQFKLVPSQDGRTRLEGTTWYQHSFWPAGYWRIWSDAIIHRIHARVLHHIKCQSE